MNAGELFKVNIEGQEHTKCIVQDMHAFTRKLTKSYGIVDITNGTMSAQRFSSVSSALAEDTGRCKVLVGICKGKKNYDKRDSLKSAQVKRDISRAIKTF